MRAVFSRIGCTISCDTKSAVFAGLIGAALIGRSVFLLAALCVATAMTIGRMLPREPEAPPAPEPERAPVAPEEAFRPASGARIEAMPDLIAFRDRLRGALAGRSDVMDGLIVALIAGGHALLEGPPGLAKTLACRTLAGAIRAAFKRVQCTPDLLPQDITGCEIYDQREARFALRFGPIFSNVLLVDEINRAPARTQAALLEAMHERQVTLAAETHVLPDPFLVLATMNESDADGVYPLPVAQLDRFLFKLVAGYPTPFEEREILDRFSEQICSPLAIATVERVHAWRAAARAVHCAPMLKDYIVALVHATRKLERGAGPRASLALLRAGRANALLAGRDYALPSDIRALAPAVLRHRVAFAHGALLSRAEAEARLAAIIEAVPVP